MKTINKKNNKYSLKPLMLEGRAKLENETIQELNAIVNVYKSLFKDIKEMYDNLPSELKDFEQFKAKYDRFINPKSKFKVTELPEDFNEESFLKFINTPFLFKKENEIRIPIQNLQKNQFGPDFWRIGNIELPKLQESLQGKAIWILQKFPTWFCDEIKDARDKTGIQKIIDFVINKAENFELKDLYKKILDNSACVDDDSLTTSIDNILEKKLYDYLRYYVGSIYSPIEIVEPTKITLFIDELYRWIKTEYPEYSLAKIKENFENSEFLKNLDSKIIELNLKFQTESEKTGQEFSRINQNKSTELLNNQIQTMLNRHVIPGIKEKLKIVSGTELNEREKQELENKKIEIAREIQKWIDENQEYKEFTLDRKLRLFFNYPSAKGDIQIKFNKSLTEEIVKRVKKYISPNIDITEYLFKTDTSSFATSNTELASIVEPPGTRRLEEIKNNFNLKSLSLKEAMEKEYD
jgi:hypothetical protein